MKVIDGNEAAVSVAYRVTELNAIYPITPSSAMGEFADQWAAEQKPNIWGSVPQVFEMQSEGGAAGLLHGALQVGALATTYTSSQGLLLMIPNMYKIAGELTPAVIHVAARALATHALSIFGDHSDVMATRQTGWAMLAGGNVQEVHDFALIAHAATLAAKIPFINFFDGFRTSHEVTKVQILDDDVLHAMMDAELIAAQRQRALTPEQPLIRGTAQNPDIYFQGRERSNSLYAATPALVTKYLERFAKLTGRQYQLFAYRGAQDAERVVILMGSGAKTAIQAVQILQSQGEKVGVIQVNLYRPFATEALVQVLPKTVRAIAVLDRTKEPGAVGEPLYQDVVATLMEAWQGPMPQVIGGRYGLGSKDFTPSMVKAVLDELKHAHPKRHFTVGIQDDVTQYSLAFNPEFDVQSEVGYRALFFGLGSDGTVGANKNTIKIIGAATDNFVQGYFVYDSKKSGSKTVSHLRFGLQPLDAPYTIQSANFIACHQFDFVGMPGLLAKAIQGATFLLNSPYPPEELWKHLPQEILETIRAKELDFYVIDAYQVAFQAGLGKRINTIMQTCFFAISNVLPRTEAIAKIKEALTKSYLRKGSEVVAKNCAAVDHTLAQLVKVTLPQVKGATYPCNSAIAAAPQFVQEVLGKIILGQGDTLPVSALPLDGTYPSATAQWDQRNLTSIVAAWDPELCIQCGQCALICPHAVIRVKHTPEAAPAAAKSRIDPNAYYRLHIVTEHCTGCGLCTEVCKVQALTLKPKEEGTQDSFTDLPYNDRTSIDMSNPRGLQFCQPLFEFSGACAGCGETPYLKLLTQLFGDRMLVANATGCSSIYGGDLTAVPWAQDANGRGPAWSNSLFEDNAEFGLGFRMGTEVQKDYAVQLLQACHNILGEALVTATIQGVLEQTEAGIHAQRERLALIKSKLQHVHGVAQQLLAVLDCLVPRSIWLVGGDGWAYDIGYGGLDHVLASGHKVNVLVMDTAVYSNTGGQASKATPLGAVAKFAFAGKERSTKDLGLMFMAYGNIYVAQIALGANPMQAIRALREAESYPGSSIIIAYSHCIAHGYDLIHGVRQQKLAVATGFWPLYRYNPIHGKLQLDSQKTKENVRDYIYNEQRFKVLLNTDPNRAKLLEQKLQDYIDKRWQKLQEAG